MPSRSRAVLGGMVVTTLIAGSAGCGSLASATLSGPPRGIVIERGDALQILPSATGGSPRDVASTDGAHPPRLERIQQLDARTVVAINANELVVVDPSEPNKVKTIATASDWFLGADGDSAWIITLATDPSCATVAPTQVGHDRYTVERVSLPGGSVLSPTRQLPCHMRPRAEVRGGLLVDELSDSAASSGHGYDVPTDIRLIDAATFEVKKTILTNAAVIQAANDTLIASRDGCHEGDCTLALSVSGATPPQIGSVAHGGSLGGAALLDHTGRYLVAGIFTPQGDTTLVFFDLKTGTSRELAPYSSTTANALDDLTDDMPAVWSGSRLLVVDPQRFTLLTYQTTTGKISSRDISTSPDDVQVWGAAS